MVLEAHPLADGSLSAIHRVGSGIFSNSPEFTKLLMLHLHRESASVGVDLTLLYCITKHSFYCNEMFLLNTEGGSQVSNFWLSNDKVGPQRFSLLFSYK